MLKIPDERRARYVFGAQKHRYAAAKGGLVGAAPPIEASMRHNPVLRLPVVCTST